MDTPLDYRHVTAIVRELSVELREGLNTEDTLADLKEFSPSEKDYIKRLLDRNGPRTANDELLNVVQRRPRAFAQLVASVKTKRNDDLLMKIWDFVKKYFNERNKQDLLEQLECCVNQIAQKHISEPVQVGYPVDGSDGGACGVGPGPERLMLYGPDAIQPGNPNGRETSPKIQLMRNDSGQYSSQDVLAQQDQAQALGKLTPEATPEKSTGPFVGGKGDRSQPTSTPATPDQNNFADMELVAVRAGILRAVGKEIGTHWQDVLESLDLDISMEDETVMEDRIEKSPSPGYKFLQLIGALKLPGNERITVRQLSDALVESNQVLANDIMLGKIDRRFRSLHQSYSDASINQRQGAIGGGSVNRDNRVDNQQLNIEPFRSLPAESNMESQVQKRTDRMKTLNILSPRSSENIDYSARPDSMESSDSNISGLQSPSQSSISSGNIPYTVNDPSIPKATDSYDPCMDHGISMDSTADRPNIENLKEYPGRPAMDEGLQNTTLNPDAELTKLNADVELQSTALGHSPASHGYEDIHAREQPGENTPTAATVDSLEYSLGSVSRLPAPDVGLNVPTTEEDSFRDGSNIIAIPRENIPHTVSSQQSQVDTSAQRGDNLSLVTRQQGEGQDQGHQVEGEDESESEGYSVGNRSQGQDQTEVHESQGEGQNDDVSIETNLNNQTTEVIDNLADLEKESLLSED